MKFTDEVNDLVDEILYVIVGPVAGIGAFVLTDPKTATVDLYLDGPPEGDDQKRQIIDKLVEKYGTDRALVEKWIDRPLSDLASAMIEARS